MQAELKVYEDIGCKTETLIRFRNILGTPIVSASVIEAPNQGGGNAGPDELMLNFSRRRLPCKKCHGTGVLPEHPDIAPSGEITCYECRGETAWVCQLINRKGEESLIEDIGDGANLNNIIRGVNVTLKMPDAHDDCQAQICVGVYPDRIHQGQDTMPTRYWVKNVSDVEGYDARIRILPDASFINISSQPIKAICQERCKPDMALGSYSLAIANGGDKRSAFLSFEGEAAIEVPIKADGETRNELARGLWLVFNESAFEGDEAVICISRGCERTRLAEDVNGIPGKWGTEDIVFGVMGSGETNCFWLKFVSDHSEPIGIGRANLEARITSV